MSTIGTILIIAAATVCFAIVFGWIWKLDAERRAKLDALAQKQGWAIEHRSSGSANTIVKPGAPASWQVTIDHGRRSGGNTGGRRAAETKYYDPDASWPGGSAVFGPAIPPQMAAMAQMVLGSLDSSMGKMLLEKLIGSGAANLTGLEHVPQPGGKEREYSMFANVNDIPASILDRLEVILKDWSAQYSKENDALIVIAGPDGVHVRMRRAIRDAGQLEQFAGKAGEITSLLKGPA